MNSMIHNVDAFEFIKSMPSNSIDLIFTDPPYAIESHNRGGGIGSKREYLGALKNIGCDLNNNIFADDFFNQMLRVLKIPNLFIFCNKIQLLELMLIADERNFKFDIIVFAKTAPTPLTNNHWLPDKEYAIHLYKKLPINNQNYHFKRTFYQVSNFKNIHIDHPTVKPLNICKSLLKNLAPKNAVVFDPFLGSGTTAIACVQNGLKYIACEINQNYYQLAQQRLKMDNNTYDDKGNKVFTNLSLSFPIKQRKTCHICNSSRVVTKMQIIGNTPSGVLLWQCEPTSANKYCKSKKTSLK